MLDSRRSTSPRLHLSSHSGCRMMQDTALHTVHPKAGKTMILPFHCLFKEGICEAIWTVPSLPPLFSGCPCFLPPILPLHGWMDEAGGERASSRPDGLMSKEPKKSNASIYRMAGIPITGNRSTGQGIAARSVKAPPSPCVMVMTVLLLLTKAAN